MKNLHKTIFRLIFLLPLFLLGQASAQPHPVADAYVLLDSTGVQAVSCKYHVVLEDTVDIDQIEIILTKSKSDTVPMVSQVVDYDVSAGLPSGWTYSRMKNTITLEVGELDKRNSYYGSVRVKTNGNWSSFYRFINQLTF